MAFSVKDTIEEPEQPAASLANLKIHTSPLLSGPDRPERYCPSLPEIVTKLKQIVLNRWSLIIIGLALVAVSLAYQARPAYDIRLGGGFDTPYLNLAEGGFGAPVRAVSSGDAASEDSDKRASAPTGASTVRDAAPEPAGQRQAYRWTRERPILLLPGLGAAPTRLSLTAAGSPLLQAGQSVEVLLNGRPFSRFELKPDVIITRQFDFGAEHIGGGNLAVEMRVTPLGPADRELARRYPATYREIDRRNGQPIYQGETGFKLYTARLEGGPGSAGPVIPPPGALLALTAAAWLLYLILAYAGLRPVWAGGIAAGLTVAAALALAFARLSLTIYTGRLALLLALTALLLPLLDWSVPRLLRRWNLPLPVWAWQGLLVMFLIGMLGRGGGVLYPHMEVIDAPFHLREINIVLHDPDGLYKQLRNKELSKVPAQWESSAIIPYSPFVYFYLAPVAALPLDPAISVNLFNAGLDAVRVFIIFALASALGVGARASLVAAGIYLIIPSTWLLNSWGNWPTTVSLWLGTLYVLLALVNWPRLGRPAVWAGATFVLLLTMLCYTVTAVFMGMLLYGWAFGLYFLTGRRDGAARRNGLLIFLSATVAALLAVLIYYAQFIPDIATTLSSFGSSLESKGSLGGFGDRSLDAYLFQYSGHVLFRYGAGAFIIVAMAVYGWLWWSRGRSTGQPAGEKDLSLDRLEPNLAVLRSGSRLWLGGVWLAVFMFFGLAQWKVDMVNKQVWFVLPLAAALAGLGLVWTWQRWRGPAGFWLARGLVAGLVLWTTYSALALWLDRVFIKRR